MKRYDPSPFEFKKGQKIICINNASEVALEVGKVYTCLMLDRKKLFITVKEIPSRIFYANRFIPESKLIQELI